MDYLFLSKTLLFRGANADEIRAMLGCLQAFAKKYNKSETIFRVGDTVSTMGLVLAGAVSIENDDIWGNHHIISHVSRGQIFGETQACMTSTPLLANVVAAEDCEVLFLDVGRIIKVCSNNCQHHSNVIRNLLTVLAERNYSLSNKMMHTRSKSTRDRLLAYLSDESMKNASSIFTIPFNRQQLADYLGVDRSAMSNELSKMQKDGILCFNKNKFELLL